MFRIRTVNSTNAARLEAAGNVPQRAGAHSLEELLHTFAGEVHGGLVIGGVLAAHNHREDFGTCTIVRVLHL